MKRLKKLLKKIIRKANNSKIINIFIKIIKVKIRYLPDVMRFYILGRFVFQYTVIGGKRKFSLAGKQDARKGQRVFYLKINRQHHTSYQCIGYWINNAAVADAFCYFVCDNKKMEYEVFRNVKFNNLNFSFISSDKKTLRTTIKRMLNGISGRRWRPVAYAMLTPFLHAAKNSFACSYNIDADDILICLMPDLVKNALAKVEEFAEEKELDCFNLDMFVSRSFGTHWSFGVVYVRTPAKCLEAVKKNENWKENSYLIEKYKTEYILEHNWKQRDDNIDWIFTFLRDTEQLKLETFYIENARVVHMPDRLMDYWGPFLLHWKNNNVFVPLLNYFYNDGLWGALPIAKGLIKIDVGLTDEDFWHYMHFVNGTNDKTLWLKCLENALVQGRIGNEIYNKYKNGFHYNYVEPVEI